MSSRSLSPPHWSSPGFDGERRAEPSMSSLTLSPGRCRPLSPGQGVTSMLGVFPLTAHASQDHPSAQLQPAFGSFEHGGLHTPPHSPYHEEESESGSELELDSPPHIIIMEPEDQEPSSPTSPPGSPMWVDMNSAVSPKDSTFGLDTEEWHTSDAEKDEYFEFMVDNFVSASEDVLQSALIEGEIDNATGCIRQSDNYADIALKHYNNEENNKVKYQLIKSISSCGIMETRGCYGHVNFIAKGNQHDSKEELFFAELCYVDDTYTVTCMVSLDRMKKVGGLRESKYDKNLSGRGVPVDAKHCYACRSKVKHPEDGTMYETGHIAISDYYHT